MTNRQHHTRRDLHAIAVRAMIERGFEPEFSDTARADLADIPRAAVPAADVRDMRARLWCSIDNDDSRDLDQLSVAEPGPNDRLKIFVAVADVDALVRQG